MKTAHLGIALTTALLLAAAYPAFAQEEPPAPPPPKEEPAADKAPTPDTPPADKAPTPDTPPAAEKTPAPETPAAAKAKTFGATAMAFAPMADSYKKAYDDMQAWMTTIDTQSSELDAQIKKLQDQLRANESAQTEAKLANDSKKSKSLQSENKQLTADYSKAQKALATARADYMKQATQRAKQYQAANDAALEQVKNQGK